VADTSGRALYLAWRPRRFDDVVGQRHVVRTIQNAVKNNTIAHAYLFSGPRGTGKTSMARLLFKAVNCLQPRDGVPCEECGICTSANEGRALDLIELDAASNRGIDDVRDLRDKINYAPADARYRVYILDEAHQLTQAAWDALLKTLEEPPPHAILVLATTEAHKVPATVLSRCQRFDFHRHTAADIRDRLALIASTEGVEVEPTVLSWLARAARGGMRDAISLFDQLRAFCGDRIDAASAREVLGLAGLETTRPFLEALQEDRPGDALEELNGAIERGTDLRTFVGDSLTYLRALLLLRYGAVAPLRQELPAEELEWLEERATEWPATRLRGLVGGFGEALARFRDPAQLLIQVELALLGDWDAADGSGGGRAAPRTTAHEVSTAYAAQFVPARQARDAATAVRDAAATLGAPPATATSPGAPQSSPTPRTPSGTSSVSSTAPNAEARIADRSSDQSQAPSPIAGGIDSAPARSDATVAASARADGESVVAAEQPAGPRPVAEPAGRRADGAPLGFLDDDGGRPLWDDDGLSDWSPNLRPAPSGSASMIATTAGPTAAAPRAAAVMPPPRPPDAPMAFVGGAAAPTVIAPATVPPQTVQTEEHRAATSASSPQSPTAAPDAPALDFATVLGQWPALREALVGGRLERVMILGTAELVDTVGATLVVQVGSGHLKLLDTDQKRRELRGELIRAMGRTVDLRFVDDYVRPARPTGRPEHGAASVAPPRPVDPVAEAAADPVVQAGLRLFGGPLVRIGGADQTEPTTANESSTPEPGAGGPERGSPDGPHAGPSDFYQRSDDEDETDESDAGAIIGRAGQPVRDWYNT